METLNLSDYDRRLIVALMESNNRLASALGSIKEEKIYSCKDAAKLIGVTQQSISRFIREGRIKKVVSRGGKVGIPQSEIDKITDIGSH